MSVNVVHSLLVIFVVALVTVCTRAFPFLIFSKTNKGQAMIQYYANVLPLAIIGMLVVFSLKNVHPKIYPYGIPELTASATVVILHVWKRNNLLSIIGGTILYMILIQFIF